MSGRTRLSPEQRREQLLELGVQWLGDRPLEELSVDELAAQAGISRGLLYHYFGGRQEYLHAVLQRMADELFEATAPVDHPDMVHRLRTSLTDYVRWVQEHSTAYRSFVQAARGGDSAEVREIFEEGKRALTDRIFASASADDLAVFGITESPASRLFARGWSSMVEDVLLEWIDAPAGLSEEQLIETFTVSLAGVLACVPPG